MSLIRTHAGQFSAWAAPVVVAIVLGLLAPAVHPLMHHDAADTCAADETTHHCDHSQHEAGFEPFHASHDLDTCVLCSRQPVASDAGPPVVVGEPDVLLTTGAPLNAIVGTGIGNASHPRAPPVG